MLRPCVKDSTSLVITTLVVVGLFVALPLGVSINADQHEQLYTTNQPTTKPIRRIHRPPRISDASLDAALSEGVSGSNASAIRQQFRLWFHTQKGACSKERAGPNCAYEPNDVWASTHAAMDSRWPVSPRWPITSTFGYRNHPILHQRRLHHGVDIGTAHGTAIRAAQSGQVIRATKDSVNGWYVVVQHEGSLVTAYCHASELLVKSGERIEKGDLVAMSGDTGRATGAHLHFGMRFGGTWVDPVVVYRLKAAEYEPPVALSRLDTP
jgi:murein DD-endopeptidase MepM/ murein hydrolase activator NlpD